MNAISEKHFSPDRKFSYSFWKDGAIKRPPLVVLPGFTGTHGDLLDFARQFKDSYDVIIPDLPGWGDSPKGTYHLTIEGYAKFVSDLLNYLKLDSVYLIGHCMGATVAIEFAYLYPKNVKELFLVGVPYLKGTIGNVLFEHLAHESEKAPKFIRPLFFFFRSRLFAIPLGFFVIQTKSLRKKLSIILKNTIKQQFQDEDLVEKNWNSIVLFNYNKLKNLPMPIHMFHGEKDMLVSATQAKRLQKINPKMTLDIIPNAGHMPPVETPQTLGRMIFHFLTK